MPSTSIVKRFGTAPKSKSLVVDLARPPAPRWRAVEREREDRLVERRHGRGGAGVAGSRSVSQLPEAVKTRPARGVVGGRRPHEAAPVRRARMIAAGARREEARRQAELVLRVVAVVAADVVAGIWPARHSALEVEEPQQASVDRVDGVEPSLAAGAVVDVHAEEDLAVRDDRRGLDLVALSVEPAESRGRQTSRAGAELPEHSAPVRASIEYIVCPAAT